MGWRAFLRVQGQHVAQQHAPQRGALPHPVAQGRRVHPERRALQLHPGLDQRAVVAEDEREADQALPADDPDLDLLPVFQRGQQGHHAALGK